MTQVSEPSVSIDAAAGDLVLRIRGTDRDGQTLRLRSSKCTIGSGPTSTLRIVARGVRPVQCLILRGRSATVVRCWCPGVRLNGRGFVDARLAPGDVLTVGPVGLEIVQCPPPAELPAGEMAHTLPRETEAAQPEQFELTNGQGWQEAEAASPDGDGPWKEHSPDDGGKGNGPSDPSSADTPSATVELLRRLGMSIDADGAKEKREAGSPGAGPREPEQAASPPPPAEEEESIDDYMSKLLARVRAAAAETAPKPPGSEEASGCGGKTEGGEASSRQEGSTTPADLLTALADGRRRVGPVPMPARAVVPERLADLSAMRELANLSAQAAISRHARRILISRSTGKLILAVLALACSGWLLGAWWFGNASYLALYGGSLGLLAALFWGIQNPLVARRILVNRDGHLQWAFSARRETEEESGAPPDGTGEATKGIPAAHEPAAQAAEALSGESLATATPEGAAATPESRFPPLKADS